MVGVWNVEVRFDHKRFATTVVFFLLCSSFIGSFSLRVMVLFKF